MNTRIILERSVKVGCWRVVGRTAKAGKRTELVPILLRADENGGTNAKDLAEHLLFESRSRRVVAERLLVIATAHGLLEEDNRVFELTEAGKQAIHTGEVFVPEDGAWTIWASDDPALPSPVLGVEPWNEPSAHDEIVGKKRKSAEGRRYEAPPDWLRAVIGATVTPVTGNAARIRIDRLDKEAEKVDTHGSLRLRWNVGDGSLQLSGTLEGGREGRRVKTELEAPDMSADRVWCKLLEDEDLLKRWDEEREALCVPFDETGDAEREAMSRALEVESPYLPGYGTFDPLTVAGVAITAESEDDAQSWAKWRLNARVRDYATSERYAAWCAEAAAPFDRFEIELPARADLARASWMQVADRPDPRVWHLVAAEDWNL